MSGELSAVLRFEIGVEPTESDQGYDEDRHANSISPVEERGIRKPSGEDYDHSDNQQEF
ncbi:hypothetical protein [Natronobiforma cellulositropha]|uniref:hypothetical protein n=1 Tax=Natronobiforma cellulositropha TaxID=1679076 RepID=UPI0021D5C42A|nr:hypothetical protein [Natronobiforma cellulositropha]